MIFQAILRSQYLPVFSFFLNFHRITWIQFYIGTNEFVYGKLRFCVRGFSNGKSEVHKNATNF
ncbi:hypothetical protein CW731_05535 [Polaribacter sp. ALD11]|nr:hypothetical protein CW731_05535 [Polaribacter sp. ALD11]